MKPVPLHPNLPTPTTAFGNPAPIAQYYICPHCNQQSPLMRDWVGLTLEEVLETYRGPSGSDYVEYARAIEAKLKEKNT